MTSVVYQADPTAGAGRSLLDKAAALFDRAGGGEIFRKGMSVAVKLHFGEEGNTGYLNPAFARAVVGKLQALKTRLKRQKGRTFITALKSPQSFKQLQLHKPTFF